MDDFIIKTNDMIKITIPPPATVRMPTKLSKRTQNGKPIILTGSTFQCSFAESVPAMQPTPPDRYPTRC